MNLMLILQAVAQLPTTTPVTSEKTETMFDIVLKGGWILAPIAFLLLVAVYVIIVRSFELHKSSKTKNLVDKIAPMLKEGNINQAITVCESSNMPIGEVLTCGLKNLGNPISDIKDSMEAEARQQVDEMSKGMNYLAIISSVAPMFGFLGTIFGVIKIFYSISLTDNISIGTISGGLYQKMISSAAGLLVGIIAFSAYHILNGRIDHIISSMERQSNRFLNLLRNK
ncbi:MAG: MotA/TolQ/ExbB proton channel family protein [Bacteroidetes bacterium]|nr:MotA/TolQ/ExbB proton channel family protein [Bacteroidota bacterium]